MLFATMKVFPPQSLFFEIAVKPRDDRARPDQAFFVSQDPVVGFFDDDQLDWTLQQTQRCIHLVTFVRRDVCVNRTVQQKQRRFDFISRVQGALVDVEFGMTPGIEIGG